MCVTEMETRKTMFYKLPAANIKPQKSISNNRIVATRIDLRVGPRVGTYRVGYQEFGNTPGFIY